MEPAARWPGCSGTVSEAASCSWRFGRSKHGLRPWVRLHRAALSPQRRRPLLRSSSVRVVSVPVLISVTVNIIIAEGGFVSIFRNFGSNWSCSHNRHRFHVTAHTCATDAHQRDSKDRNGNGELQRGVCATCRGNAPEPHSSPQQAQSPQTTSARSHGLIEGCDRLDVVRIGRGWSGQLRAAEPFAESLRRAFNKC